MKSLPPLLFLAGTQDFPDSMTFERTLRDLLSAGLQWFQLRDKVLDDRSLYFLAEKIRGWTRETDCLFTLNDRPDIAHLVEADGVHLGQTDLSALEPEFVRPHETFHLGISTHTPSEVARALTVKPDYLGVGPLYLSATKELDYAPRGPSAIIETRELTDLPIVAIGGITSDKISEIFLAGASTVAISGIISRANNPVLALKFLIESS